MAKPFRKLKAKISPERQEKIEDQVRAILSSVEAVDADETELWQEFSAWESASDEDWLKLEDRLDESREKLLVVLAKAPNVEPEEADRLPVPEEND